MSSLKRCGWGSDFDGIKLPKFEVSNVVSLSFERFLDTIPHEVLIMLLDETSNRDRISLASTSKAVRLVLRPYIFSRIKCPWELLLDAENWLLDTTTLSLVESLRISTSCSKNEWTYPFNELFTATKNRGFDNLRSLNLQSSGSTSFFKYCDVGANLRKLVINTTKEKSLFSLNHVRPFVNLESLDVSNFQIDDFEDEPELCPRLHNLKLTNCTWEYPFVIENFGRNKIVTLSLHYSNSFIISERFRVFLSQPGFNRLESMEITNTERNLKLTISLEIMKLIKAIPTLRILKLKGNIYNETLNNFTKIDFDNCMNYLAFDNVKVFYSSFFTEEQES
ncbi:unnamed protein product [Kluyveromyces dobzhanskii CBS 2104]|uniref:WGS project CCBQ000000000 data, contig MAT n=1 Tax=Kluyveromyces dobzhanskii CBS 2104 TaxID=1427455 RepID=A0A0A8L3J2_9SACH|nr:unnamed protein product [Kluyveromyces dobzhanskii CBS 2104]